MVIRGVEYFSHACLGIKIVGPSWFLSNRYHAQLSKPLVPFSIHETRPTETILTQRLICGTIRLLCAKSAESKSHAGARLDRCRISGPRIYHDHGGFVTNIFPRHSVKDRASMLVPSMSDATIGPCPASIRWWTNRPGPAHGSSIAVLDSGKCGTSGRKAAFGVSYRSRGRRLNLSCRLLMPTAPRSWSNPLLLPPNM